MRHFAFYRRITGTDRLQRAYDAAADRWQDGLNALGYPAAYNALARCATTELPASSGEAILDVGTGSGAMALAMQKSVFCDSQIDLMDLSAEMLRAARQAVPRARTSYLGPIGGADIPANAYDRVLCGHVIEHGPDPLAQIEWLFDRLRPGGQLILAVSRPHWCTAILRLRWGNAAYRPDAVSGLLSQAGFTNVNTHPHAKGPPARTSCGYTARRP
ncbi:class I SAM-dependent methyltransferase [Shimia abyssi]|uniref:Methyltransferase family protein n=1 Tax=Shimia abyssi TaxID=1662395 RepID=A0A2P8FFB5_9RHOB|nr:class I SAM-dependent methyltransferase [Shimia abyssi]PSL20415.1 methyltransferase family protein [Shimia abyssi]